MLSSPSNVYITKDGFSSFVYYKHLQKELNFSQLWFYDFAFLSSRHDSFEKKQMFELLIKIFFFCMVRVSTQKFVDKLSVIFDNLYIQGCPPMRNLKEDIFYHEYKETDLC